ncbi:inorganic diphosphatase [Aureococcus anophagefferens]|nr:inorganic diphosphatase [Aureococcus anophagefferens]
MYKSATLMLALAARGASAFAAGARRVSATALRATSTVVEGEEGTESYAQYFVDADGSKISPWHDISLMDGDAYNMVTEIPKYGTAKMEVDTKGENNPIVQDMKKGKLRFYHGPIFWNYGCLPQTWENPNEEHPVLKCFGDDDPIDVVEIGSSALVPGSVTPVKPLGVLAMIDDGELDWKVVAIAESDPLAKELDDIADWFRWYKTPDDKPINAFGFDEECPKAKAVEVIEETPALEGPARSIDAGSEGQLDRGRSRPRENPRAAAKAPPRFVTSGGVAWTATRATRTLTPADLAEGPVAHAPPRLGDGEGVGDVAQRRRRVDGPAQGRVAVEAPEPEIDRSTFAVWRAPSLAPPQRRGPGAEVDVRRLRLRVAAAERRRRRARGAARGAAALRRG